MSQYNIICSSVSSRWRWWQFVKLEQSSCDSTCCFCCCRLQLLLGFDSACWVQLQPDSGPDSEQLWWGRLHRHHLLLLLLHPSGATNLQTAHWTQDTPHNTRNKNTSARVLQQFNFSVLQQGCAATAGPTVTNSIIIYIIYTYSLYQVKMSPTKD